MTISSEVRTAGPFTGTGALSIYSFAFKVFQASDLLVVRQLISTGAQTTLALTTDYTVSLNADQDSSPGGTITLVDGALATTYKLLITSDVGNLQPTSLTNQGGFYPEVINDSLDRATIQIQQVAVKSGREVSAPLIDGTIDMTLPSAANRASKFLYFDSNGLPSAAAGTNTGNNTSPVSLTLTANNANSGVGRDVIFYDNNTETMRILGSGATSKVGIGTASPNYKLTLSSSPSPSTPQGVGTDGNVIQVFSYPNSGNVAYSGTLSNHLYGLITNNIGRLFITTTGDVGIGTSSPSQKLHVNAGTIRVDNTDANGTSFISTGTGASGSNFQVAHKTTGVVTLLNSGGGVAFETSSTERMRIDTSGNVGIGAASPGKKLYVATTGTGTNGIQVINTDNSAYGVMDAQGTSGGIAGWANGFVIEGVPASTGNTILSSYTNALAFQTSRTERMRITSGGEVFIAGTTDQGAYNLQCNGTGVWGAGAYVNGSDSRLKHDINPIGSCLNLVAAIEPVTFVYNADWSSDQTVQTGFIAQQLQTALAGQPYLDGIVSQGGEYLNVAYQNIIPLLTKSIQELKAIVEAQAARIATLEARA